MTVTAADLISVFQQMYAEHWRYEWGHSEKGCVDCSGAFCYAFRLFGISYPNGSNAIARRFTVGGLLPISQAEPGMAAFKAKEPGEKGYDLPEKYRAGGSAYNGDLRDYYHIGLVDADADFVLNAKGTSYGFSRDRLKGNGWDFVARLKDVDYGGQEMEQARVVLPTGATGSTVNMRRVPSRTSDIIARVPVGAEVQVTGDSGQWCQVEYNGKGGYMMSNYLEYLGQSGESGAITPDQYDQIDKALAQIEAYAKAISEQVELIGSITGRG